MSPIKSNKPIFLGVSVMYYLIYKITNQVNGKFYIGAHQTLDPADGYMGSSRLVRAAIKKYGLKNFKKQILSNVDTIEEMYELEAWYLDLDMVNRKDCYNIKIGGRGGHGIGSRHSEETKRKISETRKIRGIPSSRKGATLSDETKAKLRAAKLGKPRGVVSTETRKKLREIAKSSGPTSKRGICPHCNKEGQLFSMKRWHFDKCRSRVMA